MKHPQIAGSFSPVPRTPFLRAALRGLLLGSAALVLSMQAMLAQPSPDRLPAARPKTDAAVRLADSSFSPKKPVIVPAAGTDDASGQGEQDESHDDHADGEHNDDGPGLDNDHGGDTGDGDGEKNDDGN